MSTSMFLYSIDENIKYSQDPNGTALFVPVKSYKS